MLSTLYPFSYTISLLGLILWFYNSENPRFRRLMSQAFLGGFVVYAFSLAFAEGELGYKMGVLFRDMLVLGLVSQFFSFFKKNKPVFFGLLFLLFGLFPSTFYKVLNQTFPQKGTVYNNVANATMPSLEVPLDKNWELFVDLNEDRSMADLQELVDKYQLEYRRAFSLKHLDDTDLDDYFLVNIPDHLESKLYEIEEALEANKFVDYVEQNETVQISPIETLRPSKKKRTFGINDPGVQELWGFEEMQMDELYALMKSKKLKPQRKANIFILDTGVDAQHEDLKGNYQSHKKAYDSDKQGHGTHCAGIAAAVTNNNLGVASYSPNTSFVNVTSIKVLSDFGGGTQQSIISGMLEAADNGADVISMSLGGRSNQSRKRAYARAVNYCNRQGAIVLAAAGNSNMDAAQYSPANAPGIITVAAVDTNLQRAHFSNYVQNVQYGIAAPGVKIYSTFPNNKYQTFNGTSMACPYVAGLVGLMKSIKPELTTKEVYEILEETGKATGATNETGKLIQPAKVIGRL